MFNLFAKEKERDGKHNIRFHLEQEEPMRNNKTAELVLTALFAAIIIIMAFTPLGYIPLVVINATIIHIPVILGALFCGPKKGGFLGFIFGLTSFIKNTVMPTSLSAFVFSPVLAASMVGTSGIVKSAFICFCTAYSCRNPAIFCIYRSKESTFFPAQNSLGKCV